MSVLAYSFVFADSDFWQAFWTDCHGRRRRGRYRCAARRLLAFVMVRTDVRASATSSRWS